MATALVTRVERLEAIGDGGDECPRCSGMVGVFFGGKFSSASKHGKPMTEEEWREIEAEEDEDGRCPVCGERGEEIVVGWSEEGVH